MSESPAEHTETPVSFKVTDLFRLYKAASELVHAEDTPDLEAPVKIALQDGTEFVVTSLHLELNPETAEQVVWLDVVIDE